MTDIRETIAPKSDQMNADDLIGITKTIKITKVSKGGGDQPISVNYEGDNGKPFKPGLSMRRVMVQVWGDQGQDYVGKSMTLYRDPTVKWAGVEVGGIRISHMSHINESITMALTYAKTSRKPFTVQPLVVQAAPAPAVDVEAVLQEFEAASSKGMDSMKLFWSEMQPKAQKILEPHKARLKRVAELADGAEMTPEEIADRGDDPAIYGGK